MILPEAPMTVMSLPETEIKGPVQCLFPNEVVRGKVTMVLSFKPVKTKVMEAPSMVMEEQEDLILDNSKRLGVVRVQENAFSCSSGSQSSQRSQNDGW